MNKLQLGKIGISLSLLITCAGLASCGDEKDPRLSDADVACLKYVQAGLPCSAANTNSIVTTATATTTSTVTVTATTTVN